MIKSNRNCSVQNHQNAQVSFICTYATCDSIHRWACEQCIQEYHDHGIEQKSHIMKQQEFLNLVTHQQQIIKDKNEYDSQFIQSCLKDLNQFIEMAKSLKESLLKDLNSIEKQNNLEYLDYLAKITKNDFLQLDEELISDFIGIQNYLTRLMKNEIKCDIRMSQETLQNIRQQYQEIKQFIVDHEQQYIEWQELKNKELKKINYKQQEYSNYLQLQPEIEYDYSFTHSQISYDEKYLAVLQGNNQIQIFSLDTKQLIKRIQLQDRMTICIFSDDSQYLFCADQKGSVFCYEVNNEFNEKYKKSLHTEKINYIMLIDDQMITCSDDCSIIISNIADDKQQVIKKAHNDRIQGLDYDYQKSLIISCAFDSFINFYNKNTHELVISQKFKHSNGYIELIKLVSDNKNLIISENNIISLVFIDYQNRNFQFITKMSGYDAYCFSITNFDTRIITILNNRILILDPQLHQIQEIGHNVKTFHGFHQANQLNSMNYIIILGLYDMQILKRT